MAITTLSGVRNGLLPTVHSVKEGATATTAGVFVSSWYRTGYPPAAIANTSGLSGEVITSGSNGITFPNPVSGNTYLTAVKKGYLTNPATATMVSTMLIDRLWHNSGIALNTVASQTVNSPTWPARDINGSTNGDGVYIAVEVSNTFGISQAGISIVYTNSQGVSGRFGGVTVTTLAAAGRIFFLNLNQEDVGVRSVQSVTVSNSTTGTIHLIAYRPIALLDPASTADASVDEDALSLGMPQLWNGTTLQTVSCLSAASGGEDGGLVSVHFSQG